MIDLLTSNSILSKNGVYYLDDLVEDQFESHYIKLRDREGRFYDDLTCQNLPDVPRNHIHYKEWGIRKSSADLLIRHLSQNSQLNVLEIGCGNGWLANYIQKQLKVSVLGIDRNKTELEQANRVFGRDSLHFAYGDLFKLPFKESTFDAVVFAASIQYFSKLNEVIDSVLPLLSVSGSLYIVDTPFYKNGQDVKSAKLRTNSYYESAGASVLNEHYHHHEWSDISNYTFEVIYDPNSLINKIRRKVRDGFSPFPVVRIEK